MVLFLIPRTVSFCNRGRGGLFVLRTLSNRAKFRFLEKVLVRFEKNEPYLNNRSQNLCLRFAIRDAFSTAESKSGRTASAASGALGGSTALSVVPSLAGASTPGP